MIYRYKRYVLYIHILHSVKYTHNQSGKVHNITITVNFIKTAYCFYKKKKKKQYFDKSFTYYILTWSQCKYISIKLLFLFKDLGTIPFLNIHSLPKVVEIFTFSFPRWHHKYKWW